MKSTADRTENWKSFVAETALGLGHSGEPVNFFTGAIGVQTTNPARSLTVQSVYEKTRVHNTLISTQPADIANDQILRSVAKLEAQLSGIEQEHAELYRLLAKLSESFSAFAKTRQYTTTLQSVGDESFEVFRAIPVLVEGDGEDFTATFLEANVSASGETEADALDSLKESLSATFDVLDSLPEDSLGPLPARQKLVLSTVMKRAD